MGCPGVSFGTDAFYHFRAFVRRVVLAGHRQAILIPGIDRLLITTAIHRLMHVFLIPMMITESVHFSSGLFGYFCSRNKPRRLTRPYDALQVPL